MRVGPLSGQVRGVQLNLCDPCLLFPIQLWSCVYLKGYQLRTLFLSFDFFSFRSGKTPPSLPSNDFLSNFFYEIVLYTSSCLDFLDPQNSLWMSWQGSSNLFPDEFRRR